MFRKKKNETKTETVKEPLTKKENDNSAALEGKMNVKKERKDYSANSGGINAFLGRGTEFEGKLIFDGVVRLDGKFQGEIISNDTLVVGESAVVDAEIKVDTIIISGKIKGNIVAKNRIEVHAPGKLYGNVQTPVFVLEEGVVFEGSCSMESVGNKGQKAELKAVEEVKNKL